jgi:uncharacterized membrane protein SirB2
MLRQFIVFASDYRFVILVVLVIFTFILLRSIRYALNVIGDEDYAAQWLKAFLLMLLSLVIEAALAIMFVLTFIPLSWLSAP